MKLRWTPEALDDLTGIRTSIARRRPLVADQVIRKIKASTRLLIHQPMMGRIGRIKGTREWVVTGLPYVIPYILRVKTLLILRVIHTSIEWDDEYESD